MPAAVPRLLALLALLFTGQARAAETIVHATREGDTLYVEASAEFRAGQRQVWQVLTDYDHLAGFIPGMLASRIVARDGTHLVVEQKGEIELLFFSRLVEVTLAVEEFPFERVTSRAISGSFRQMHGTYFIEKSRNGVRLRYAGRLTPDFFVPPLIGTIVLRRDVERQFGALVGEILRRQKESRLSGATIRSRARHGHLSAGVIPG